MKRKGLADLPLHHGRAPIWLVNRMIKLANSIITIIINEYGINYFLHRISDPYWFQALGCVLGYDWHSSGVTTVGTAILKRALNPEEIGLAICGGKGRASLKTIPEIEAVCDVFGLSTGRVRDLRYASRMSAKIDNTAIQAGYPLYHHAFIMTEKGDWAVVQQGINVRDKTARRYHWLSENVETFVVEPHNAIVGDVKKDRVLDMTAKKSEECRRTSIDIIKEGPKKIVKTLKSIRLKNQKSLINWIPQTSGLKNKGYEISHLKMPLRINWKALNETYDFQPRNYEELLEIRGIGSSTIRGIALISELIYGDKPSRIDPVKFSFAYGGKDGVPYPVNTKAMDESIQILKEAIKNAKIGDKAMLNSLNRLSRIAPPNM